MTPADRAALAVIGIHIALACNEDDEALRTAALDEAMRRIKVLARRRSGRVRSGRYQLVDVPGGRGVELDAGEIKLLIIGIQNALSDLKATGYGQGDKLAAQYRELLEKLRGL